MNMQRYIHPFFECYHTWFLLVYIYIYFLPIFIDYVFVEPVISEFLYWVLSISEKPDMLRPDTKSHTSTLSFYNPNMTVKFYVTFIIKHQRNSHSTKKKVQYPVCSKHRSPTYRMTFKTDKNSMEWLSTGGFGPQILTGTFGFHCVPYITIKIIITGEQ